MNFYELLYAGKNSGALSATYYELLFAKYLNPGGGDGWATYDGTLPAQYSANGDYLADYRIYGAAGGVGDRTVNLCTQLIVGTYESTGYETTYAHMACTTQPILFDEGKITISVSQGQIYLKKIENGVWVQTIVAAAASPATITIPSPGTYAIQINAAMTNQALKEINDTIVAVKGSTAPTSHIPYGYEVDMSTRGENLVDVSKWLTDRSVPYQKVDDTYTFDVNIRLYTIPYYFAEENKKITIKCQGVNLTPNVNFRLNLIDINGSVVKDRAITESISETKDVVCAGFVLDYGIGGTIQLTDFEIFESAATPIYIGSDPLGEDEYVDYGKGKIYRKKDNLFIPQAATQNARVVYADGSVAALNDVCVSDYIEIDSGETYTLDIADGNLSAKTGHLYAMYDSNKDFVYTGAHPSVYEQSKYVITVPNGIKYIRFNTLITAINDTAFYLGVGALIPVDPPVPLPALPTVDGTTITGYVGQSAPPSRFYAKYKKG